MQFISSLPPIVRIRSFQKPALYPDTPQAIPSIREPKRFMMLDMKQMRSRQFKLLSLSVTGGVAS
ncbi:hypothetical protein PENSUB_6144 [Penicillium subrubescens]|uniref:Uncharacterized protein n=1 Tax=Penicillium subrubescens TaxID=1316194 RepID=A0A1Q5U3B1_9EURO|nr:hypothetical protein PENSUB_6144 [Penicillium subrubescens]